MEVQKNTTFEGIRGFAFFIVLVAHGFLLCMDGAFFYIQGVAKYGVWLFFVLSAYLLTKNYILTNRKKLDFIFGRIFRILPIYYIGIFLYHYFNVFLLTPQQLPLAAIAFFGPIHFWTIPVEFYFYFLLLLVWFVRSIKAQLYIMTLLAIASFSLELVVKKEDNSINFIWYLPSFYFGYLAAIVSEKHFKFKCDAYLIILILLIFIILIPGVGYVILGAKPSGYLSEMYAPLSALWALFILLVINTKSETVKMFFNSRALIFLGAISYPGYVFHWLVMLEIKKILGNGMVTVICGALISVIFAFIVHLIIEIPLHKIRTKLKNSQS